MASVLKTISGSDTERPPLRDGDRMSQPEFHRRYEWLTEPTHYELLNGMVHMTPAERLQHGRYNYLIGHVLATYEEHTPGVAGAHNSSLILDECNEPQADLHLRIRPEYQGTSATDADGYVTGPPELVIEIAYSSLQHDLTIKRDVYRQQGVKEYLVVCVEPAEFRWFVWPDGECQLASDSIFRSAVFPGLWIDSHALFQEETAALIKTVRRGLETPLHAEFVAQMESRRKL
jgi:Uma2 family endonuclease